MTIAVDWEGRYQILLDKHFASEKCKRFLLVIVVVILQSDTIEQNMAFLSS